MPFLRKLRSASRSISSENTSNDDSQASSGAVGPETDHSLRQEDLDVDYRPQLLSPSTLLTDEDLDRLNPHFFARLVGADLQLAFSTDRDGFSLRNAFRKMEKYVDMACLLVIRDGSDWTFGAVLPEGMRFSNEHFYGTGQAFLFRLRPDFQVWQWTGRNDYCMVGHSDTFAIGSGDACFGIFLDGNLHKCRTQRCPTFDNEPLTATGDFAVTTLEAWSFVPSRPS